MQSIISVLVPIFFLIFLGYIFKKISFPSLDFWPMLDRLTYYVLFPSLLVYNLSTANLNGINGFDIVIIVFISIVIVLFIAIILNFVKKNENMAFTSIIQGSIRFNAYVFLSVADAFLGENGLIIAAVIMTFSIPLVNFLCIGAFSYYVNSKDLSFASFIKSILTNPLIMACIVGGVLNLSGLYIPDIFTNMLKILGSAALAVGLLSVGVGLEFSHINTAKYELFLATFLKLVLFPLCAFFVASFFEISKETLIIIILFAAMPTATSSYILARQLGGDTKLMSSIITFQTLLSIISIGVIIKLLNI